MTQEPPGPILDDAALRDPFLRSQSFSYFADGSPMDEIRGSGFIRQIGTPS